MRLHRRAMDDGVCACRLLWRNSGILALLSQLANKWLEGWTTLFPIAEHFRQRRDYRSGACPVWEALQQSRLGARYTVGSWVEQPPLPPRDSDLEQFAPEHREAFNEVL